MVESDQSAATELFIGNLGLAVVSDQATAVGVTAVPTPATDRGSDLWFLIEEGPGCQARGPQEILPPYPNERKSRPTRSASDPSVWCSVADHQHT